AKLDARGEARVEVPLPVDEQGSDYTATIEARVADQSGQEVSGAGRTVATYGEFLIAASTGRFVFRPRSPVSLRLRVVDYAGQPQVDLPVNVWLARHAYTYDDATGRSEEREALVTQGVVSTDASGRATWTTRLPAEGGSYRLYASARSEDRVVKSSAWAWVPQTGEESTWDREQQLELIPDRKSYQPGDTARFVIRGADATGPMLVTKEGRTITWHRVSRLPAGALLEVPIEEQDLGNTWVNMVFLKDDRVYQAERRVDVPPLSQALQVTVTARAALSRPREPGLFTIRTLDSSGNPVRAQVSVGVVDEAVYGVKPDTTPDPLRVFYRNEYSRVGTQFSRTYSFVGYAGTRTLKLASKRRPLTLADFKAERPERPFVRKQFPDAIYWVADLVTDETGTATVEVDYPDSLTTWRVTARAITTDTKGGTAVARATTTKDVILRIVPPRFLTEGDRVRLPTVAHSYLEGTTKINVSLQANGIAKDTGFVDTQSCTLGQGGEQRQSWPLVARQPGNARLTGSALTAGPDSDSVEITLPILPYGLAREEGVSGSLHEETAKRVSLTVPERANPAARRIQVTLAPSLAGAMLGALDYLVTYPYGCTEQTVSSFVPNLLVLRALIDLHMAPTGRAALVDRRSAEGLNRLIDLQNDEGGWGWWKTAESDPFMTAYALWALIEARRAGLAVDQSRLQRAADALATLYAKYPRAVLELKAYETYVLALGRNEGVEATAFDQRAALDALWSARGRMSAYGRALLLLALDPRPANDSGTALDVGKDRRA
ncbi:MAG: alpha-2-macroglobulin family protein, partial [Vicinamibacteraceae bacterium]